jgi:hypothetical protein
MDQQRQEPPVGEESVAAPAQQENGRRPGGRRATRVFPDDITTGQVYDYFITCNRLVLLHDTYAAESIHNELKETDFQTMDKNYKNRLSRKIRRARSRTRPPQSSSQQQLSGAASSSGPTRLARASGTTATLPELLNH